MDAASTLTEPPSPELRAEFEQTRGALLAQIDAEQERCDDHLRELLGGIFGERVDAALELTSARHALEDMRSSVRGYDGSTAAAAVVHLQQMRECAAKLAACRLHLHKSANPSAC